MRFILVAVALLAASAGVAMYLWGVPPSLRPGPDLDALRSAAEQGDPYAQFNLGAMYANGVGVLKDDAEAVRWWRLAAHQGDVDAQYALGSVYAGAPGGAAAALREAEADPLSLVAGFLLGTVPTDFVPAGRLRPIPCPWSPGSCLAPCPHFVPAHANGHEDAALGRDALELLMSAADVARATRLARACRASDYRDCGQSAASRNPAAAREPALDRPTRRLIQQRLANEGFDPGTPDGQFGPRTRAAVRTWQAARGAAATGYLDDVQAELLRSAAAPGPEAPAGVEGPAGASGEKPRSARTSPIPSFFTRGSHQDDVLRLQGTPIGIDTLSDSEIWRYGLSTVTISKRSREVTEWWNLGGNLRVRLVPGPPRAAEPAPGAVFRPGAGIVNPRLLREVRPQPKC